MLYKTLLSARKVRGLIPGSVKLDTCQQRLATVATFLRSDVAHARARGDGPRHSMLCHNIASIMKI